MKKIFFVFLVFLLVFTFCACGANTSPAQDSNLDSMKLEDIMTSILPETEFVAFNTELTEETFKSFLFIDYISNSEAIASEPMMGTLPHSVVLLRLPDDSDTESVAKMIEDNADPRKWICVEADKVAVENRGNTILLVMSTEEITNAVVNNFEKL